MVEGSGAGSRAYGALSFEEEKHALLAHAHLALAAKFQEQEIERRRAAADWGQAAEAERARSDHDRLWEDLSQNIAAASPAAKGDGEILHMVMSVPDLRSDPDFLAQVTDRVANALDFVNPDLLEDKATMLKLVSHDGNLLAHAVQELQGDKELVLAAVSSSAWALGHASGDLQADREVVMAALRAQTRRDVQTHNGDNVFHLAKGALPADLDLVLEAVRVDGYGAIAAAADEPLKSEDFLLRAMRKALPYEKPHCFGAWADRFEAEFAPPVYYEAADSALALRGDNAPVLTVTLPTAEQGSSTSNASCQVTLLSGASFSCSLQAAHPPWTIDSMSVDELAVTLLQELPKHAQLDPSPTHVFLVFAKPGSDGEDATAVSVWDHHRPISDFSRST